MEDLQPIQISDALLDQIADLEYEDTDTVRGVLVDLNADGVQDYIIVSVPSLCGNGGCPYALIDGQTGSALGQLFGTPLYILPQTVHGFRIITSYNHVGAGSATYTTYASNGRVYVVRSTRRMTGASLDSLVRELGRIPSWRPHP